MPIEVHCPNPGCARVHLVKDRYAGMRGKCPVCSSWMYVPKIILQPVESPDEKVEDVGKSMMLDEDVTRAERPLAKRASKPPTETPQPKEEPPAAPAPAEPATPPTRRFSWLAAALMLIGVAGLGTVSASSFLEVPTLNASGEIAKAIGDRAPRGIDPEYAPFVTVAGAVVAAVVLLALLSFRLGLLSRFLLYLGTVGSAVILFLGLASFKAESVIVRKVQESIDHLKQTGVGGDASPSLGLQYHAAVGGAAAACLFGGDSAGLRKALFQAKEQAYTFVRSLENSSEALQSHHRNDQTLGRGDREGDGDHQGSREDGVDGGVVHEEALWDANEMALDGEPKESIADRIRRNRAMPYVPKGGWVAR